MGYPNFNSARQYDHLTIPDTTAARRKSSSKIEYLEPHRRARQQGSGRLAGSRTLQYDLAFDLERAALDRRAYYTNGQRRGTSLSSARVGPSRGFQQPELSRPSSAQKRASVHFTDFKTVEPAPAHTQGLRVGMPAAARPNGRHAQTAYGNRLTDSVTQRPAAPGSAAAAVERRRTPGPAPRAAASKARARAGEDNRGYLPHLGTRKRHPDVSERTISGIGTRNGLDDAGAKAAAPIRPTEWQRKRAKNALSTVVTIVLVFALLACVLVGYARNSSISHENASLREVNENLEADISKLEMQIALDDDLGTVQQRAAALGMGAPEDSQLQYVAFDPSADASGTLLNGYGQPAERTGFFETLSAWLQGIFGTH